MIDEILLDIYNGYYLTKLSNEQDAMRDSSINAMSLQIPLCALILSFIST